MHDWRTVAGKARTVGILDLQGGVEQHARMLDRLGQAHRRVRRPADLDGLQGLILPGGESTALSQLLARDRLDQAIIGFAEEHPVLGTCAGLILMSARTDDARVQSLELLDVEITRNHYGRQRESFIAKLDSTLFPDMCGIFIRAPALHSAGRQDVLARHNGSPVAVRQGHHIGCSFHPELGRDTRLHAYWLNL